MKVISGYILFLATLKAINEATTRCGQVEGRASRSASGQATGFVLCQLFPGTSGAECTDKARLSPPRENPLISRAVLHSRHSFALLSLLSFLSSLALSFFFFPVLSFLSCPLSPFLSCQFLSCLFFLVLPCPLCLVFSCLVFFYLVLSCPGLSFFLLV